MGFTLTRIQYEEILGTVKKAPDEARSTIVKLGSQQIEAALLYDNLYVATFKNNFKEWEPVSHLNLKDVLIEPAPSSGSVKQGRPHTPKTCNLQPPQMPVFTYLDDSPSKSFYSYPATFPFDTRWRAGTRKLLSEKAADWHTSQAVSLQLLDDHPNQLAYANANMWPSADLSHKDAFASPQQSMFLSDESFSIAASSGRFSAASVLISPVQGDPVTFDPHQVSAQLQPTTAATSDSIKDNDKVKKPSRRQRPVDRFTGKDVPAGTPNAVAYRSFQEHRTVYDPLTRLQVPPGTKGARTFGVLQRLKLVDAKDGTPANAETKQRISREAWYGRTHRENKRKAQNKIAL